MRTEQKLSNSQICELMDALSVQQEAAQKILSKSVSLPGMWTLADYLDTAALFPSEKRSILHRQVVHAVTVFIERNLHNGDAVSQMAEHSWVFAELVEVELQQEELELTMDFEAIPVEAVEVLTRVAALDCNRDTAPVSN
jgi:hypothetical protein